MKRLISTILAITLVLALLCSLFIMNASAAETINFQFTGENKSIPGYAEGTVTITGSSGATYYLYWADDNKALDGYSEIASIKASGTTATFSFQNRVAIPKGTKYLVAFKTTTEPNDKSVSKADLKYQIPKEKRIGDEKSYSFAAFSDIHMDEPGSNYPYDEDHLKMAFSAAAKRNVDFVITSGDHVNNAGWDNGGNRYNMFYTYEYATYQKILAESDYVNPVYEAIGNHELWNGDTESSPKKDQAGHTQYNFFIKATGLDSNTSTIANGKAYYEITEKNTGDHFIFLALEGGFYTDRVNEFTTEQLNWLESKLESYKNDKKNIYIIEHANFYKWGAGDILSPEPLYDIPLKPSCSSTKALENLLSKYQNAVVITGHTHFQFSDVPNISDNSKTSSIIMHNSSVGGVRKIINNKRVNAHDVKELCQGYMVNVYGNGRVFSGTDLYKNLIIPQYTYIVGTPNPEKDDPTIPSTEPTTIPTTESTTEPTTIPTTEPTTEPTTQPTTEPKPVTKYGDADCNKTVEILDASAIQKDIANIKKLSAQGIINASVENGKDFSIVDATLIQKFLANIIDHFPVEDLIAKTSEQNELEIAKTSDSLSSEVETYLKKQYVYSSYNQYQSCKKALKEYKAGTASAAKLTSAYNELKTIVQKYGEIADEYYVYFTDNQNWGQVYCYAWGATATNAAWPGVKMTYDSKNDYGQSIYKVKLKRDTYDSIIFTKSSSGPQTQDLKLICMYNPQYFPTYASDSKFYCGISPFKNELK